MVVYEGGRFSASLRAIVPCGRKMAAVAALSVALAMGGQAQGDVRGGAADVPPILKIGAQAPEFNLPGTDGKMHSLNEHAASKVLVIVFTCDHCPVAQMYEKRIKQLTADYRNRRVAIVAINPNDPKAVPVLCPRHE